MDDPPVTSTKYFFCTCFIVSMCGCSLLVVTSKQLYSLRHLHVQIDYELPALVNVVNGVFLVIAGFICCCRDVVEKNYYFYAVSVFFLALIIISIVACAVWVFESKDTLNEEASKNLDQYVLSYHKDAVSKKLLDFIQNWLGCCGSDGPADFGNATLPRSCCAEGAPCLPSSPDLRSSGCRPLLLHSLDYDIHVSFGVELAAAVILLLLLIYTVYTASTTESQEHE